jgi:hypothetical protein
MKSSAFDANESLDEISSRAPNIPHHTILVIPNGRITLNYKMLLSQS